MAGPLGVDTTLDTSGIAPGPPPPPTPLQGLTGSLGLVPSFQAAGEKEAAQLREGAGRRRVEAADIKASGEKASAEEKAARPGALELPPGPSTEMRPFLAPGKGMLAEIQAAIVGVGQVAMGGIGLKGKGYATASLAGLTGAMEGWKAGDHDRVKRSLVEWQNNTERLLEQHRAKREAYADLLTSNRADMANRLAQLSINARIDGDEAAALAAERGNIGELITILGTREQQERQFGLQMRTLENSIAQHHETASRLDRAFEATQAQRRTSNERAAESLKMRKENQAGSMKLEKEDDSISSSLRTLDTLSDAVTYADSVGVIPRGPTVADKAAAKLALQTHYGDAKLADAVETIRRLGTAQLVGSEVAAGLSPGVARLKVVGEAEAAGADAIPKSFWDKWFDRQKQSYLDRRKTIRAHLQARRPAGGDATEPDTEGGDDPLGIK